MWTLIYLSTYLPIIDWLDTLPWLLLLNETDKVDTHAINIATLVIIIILFVCLKHDKNDNTNIICHRFRNVSKNVAICLLVWYYFVLHDVEFFLRGTG